MTPNPRQHLRNLYRDCLPLLILEYPRYDPYIVAWEGFLTRDEFAVWEDIRCVGLPLLPKLPVDSYFIDFADPVERIGIMVVHRSRGTRQRSTRSGQLHWKGWKIYRIEAWRTWIPIKLTPAGELYCVGHNYLDTSEGIIQQIKKRHYTPQA